MVLQSVQPYMSSESIDKGTRWASSIANELEDTAVGIVVLTPDNLDSSWIYFESGALAKVVGDSKLAPLLCGLKPSDIGTPLSQFQVTVFNSDDILRLLKSINACSGIESLPEARLEKMHNALWVELSKDIEPIIHTVNENPIPQKNPDDDTSRILEELLVLTRQQSQTLMSSERNVPKELVRTIIEIVSEYGQSSPDVEPIRSIVHHLYTIWKEYNSFLDLSIGEESEVKASQISQYLARIELVMRDLMDVVQLRRKGRARFSEHQFNRAQNTLAHAAPKSDDNIK